MEDKNKEKLEIIETIFAFIGFLYILKYLFQYLFN